MIIRWKCACMPREDLLEVADRRSHNGVPEDIIKWMNRDIRPAIGDRHRELSPSCNSRQMETLKIQIGNTGIGRPN